MGPICANGLLHAAAEEHGSRVEHLADGVRGRNVVVTGAGVVGLLTALFTVRGGAASVLVADPDPDRLATATALGLDVVDDDGLWREAKQRWVHGPADRGADVVLQCRGRAAVLQEALRALRPQGTVIDLAFYQGGADELRLGEEFHHNGLTVRCAQIVRVPRGLAGSWDRARLAAETAALLAERGAELREHLVSHVVPIEQGPSLVAALARRETAARQVVFEFGLTMSSSSG
jgi:threonine dehydrogenase-like Zn-dependent dehydrogenase